ncbi:hypothetical protein ACFL3V_06445 [Nanoarchaeota archaeon]
MALFCSTAAAQTADNSTTADPVLAKYDTHMHIAYNKVLVESSMTFPQKQAANLSIELPYDARNIINQIDNFEIPAILQSNNLVFYLKKSRNLKFSYITDELLEKDTYIASMTMPIDTEAFRLRVSLPEKAILDRPVRQRSTSGSAVFPKPKRLETDGQVITVVWEMHELKKGDELAFYIKYRKPVRYLLPLVLMIIGVLVIAAVITYFMYKANNRKTHSKASEAHKTHEKDLTEHLKEDEQQVINVLKLKEGSCEQGTLRVATGLSKTKLSLLLKELEERNIIHKEKRGKKNLVFLK